MRQVRDRIYRLLDGRLRLREQADLYFLAGCINGLMGLTANRLATVSRTPALFLTRCGAVSSALRSQRTASALVRGSRARARPTSTRKLARRDDFCSNKVQVDLVSQIQHRAAGFAALHTDRYAPDADIGRRERLPGPHRLVRHPRGDRCRLIKPAGRPVPALDSCC
jgi:hypothetical protein